LTDDTRGTAVQLDVMVTGQVPIPHAYVFRPEGGNRLTRLAALFNPRGRVLRSPCLAYRVLHPTAGVILIDTGFHPDASENRRKDFGTRMSLLFRNLKPAEPGYEEQLRALGADPGGVERVIMTHLHVDHTSGLRLLPHAKVVCSRDEWSAANRQGAAGKGYVASHLPDESRIEFVDFEEAGEPHGPFSKTIDLLGDDSIRLISTPGHTAGHMSLLLRMPGGRRVLVVGDAVYTLRSMREEILPFLTTNDELYLRSLRELKTFSEQQPEATLVPSHDPTAWQALRHVTASAEKAPLSAT
jgi:N-acyl homoserine lactone hydrolase